MKKTVLCAVMGICILVLVGGCKQKEQSPTFAEGFQQLADLDKKFNASFKQEQLNQSMVAEEKTDAFIKELEAFKKNLQKKLPSKDQEALLFFMDIRKDMLLSQKYYQLGEKIGDIGLVKDESGFSCSEIKYLLDAAHYFNLSFVHGSSAVSHLDDVLYQYQDVNQLQDLVGLNQNKTAFYKSPLDHAKNVARDNMQALEKNCRFKVVTKEPKDL